MKLVKKKISELKTAPYNPRIDIKEDKKFYEKLHKSIQQFGYVEPIIWNKQTSNIVGGNQRLQILKDNNTKEVEVVEVDLSIDDEKALNIALNKVTGDWDYEKLNMVLKELSDHDYLMDLTGFDSKEIDSIIDQFRIPEEEGFNVDEALQKPPKYTVKRGEVYQLEEHRVMCGNSTNKKDVDHLINKSKAQLIVINPPYNVNYSSKNELLNLYDKGNHIQTPIKNHFLSEQEYIDFTKIWMINTLDVLDDYNSIYVFGNYESLGLIMSNERFVISNMLVWVKNSIVLGRMDYKCQHEFILYGWKKHHKWHGKNNKSTVFNFNKPLSSKLHPTMKPIELLIELIHNSSKPDYIVYDPFGGSGSTLIACEQTNRKCYMMEIDPVYISVIIDRWETLTNKKHKKVK